jgi:1,4-alpha-glucan branching enzyme
MDPADADKGFRNFVRTWQTGECCDAWYHLGAGLGTDGQSFAVWAPNARAVSVCGDFNQWSASRSPLMRDNASGIWRGGVPAAAPGMHYAFAITGLDGHVRLKTDPFARSMELRPGHSARIPQPSRWVWQDADWIHRRQSSDPWNSPVSIYEVHATSWYRDASGWLDYRALAHRLVEHAQACGFTHIEFLPLMEHWLDESWGYQVHAPFAPTSRLGTADDLRYLVDYLHRHDIGVIFDLVPGHFPDDVDALADFDGQALFEYADHRRGRHQRWGTRVYDYARHEVCSYLLSMATYWCEEFHIDGLRIDAVSSMLYRDYDRPEWEPNHLGGNQHFEAMDFLKRLNTHLHARFPGILMMAEESTAWPGVTSPVHRGGLGFGFKWNMGWMNDSLRYFSRDPVHRSHHHEELTFSRCYAFSEQFVLPFSHDEVVHGKRSLLGRMPGDEWQRFANLRLLLCWLFLHPGKKLLFMGGEWGVVNEWNVNAGLDWGLLDDARHAGIKHLVADLNRLYRTHPALHQAEGHPGCFEWIEVDNHAESLLAFARHGGGRSVVCVLNFTPVPRWQHRLQLGGRFREIFNSDSTRYGGGNLGNAGWVGPSAGSGPCKPSWSDAVTLVVPPLGALLLEPCPTEDP